MRGCGPDGPADEVRGSAGRMGRPERARGEATERNLLHAHAVDAPREVQRDSGRSVGLSTLEVLHGPLGRRCHRRVRSEHGKFS